MRLPTEDDLQIHGHWECNDRMRRLLDSARLVRELVPRLKRYFALNYERSQAFQDKDGVAVKATIDKQWPVFQEMCELLATIEDEGGGQG